MRELAYLNKFFLKYKWRFLLGILFVSISNYFRVLQPQVIRHALDLVVDNVNLYRSFDGFELKEALIAEIGKSLFFFMGLVIAFAFLMGFFMYFMRQTLIVMSRWIEFDLRNEIYHHYQKLDQAFYKKNNTGDMMARITEDVNHVRTYIGPAIMYSINLVVLSAMVIYSMINVSPTLTFYALLPLPILSFSIYYVTNLINRKSTEIQTQLSVLNSLSQEVYSGIRVVKSYCRESSMADFFSEETDRYKEKSMGLVRINALFTPLMLLLIGLSTIITIYVGGILVLDGSISTGNIAEFVIYINMLTWPVTSIGWVASIIQRAAASQKRINEFLSISPDIVKNDTQEQSSLEGDIEFDGVTFVYPDTNIVALKNLSFELKSGQKMAIVGKTGAGKSTIAELLVRMYDVHQGSISIDGKHLKDHDLSNLRERIAYVPQDVFLFSDSVENNIGFGINEPDHEKIVQYAKYAAVHEDILNLSDGYETIVGERGITLSGGQKQRISIARALMKEPDILLLDDCLSAVDSKTEAKIADYLNEFCSDKTTIIVTHRLYSNIQFDNIIVMDKGEIIEQGNHQELIAINGYYAEMYKKQLMEEANQQNTNY